VKLLAVGVLVGTFAGCGARDPPCVTRTGVLDSLVALGEQMYRREEYDSVRVFLGPVADRARVTGDSAAEARARTWLGLAFWRLSDYPRARAEQERALGLKLALHLDRELWRSHNALGLLAWNEGRLVDALRQYDSATAAAARVGDSVGIGSTAGNIALVQTELGDFTAARQGFERMRAIGQVHSNARAVGNALNNLGMLAIRIGDADRAIPLLREALQVYRDIDYATGEQNALGQLGTAYAALGEPQHAFATLDSALQQARRLGLRQEEASDVESLAELHRVAGDLTQALELYAVAKALNQELGQPLELGTNLRNEADIHVQLGDLDGASRSAGAALAAHREAGARFEELSDLLLLADITDRANQTAVSAGYLRAAHSLSTTLDVRVGRLAVALVEARIADRRRDARRVLQVLDDAAADVRAGGYDMEWECELLRGRAEARRERLAAAAAAGRRAVAAVERVRSHYGSGMLRTTYGADRSQAYSDLVRTLRQLGQVDEAFTVSDAARGRALLDARLASAGGDEQIARRAILGEIDGLVVNIEHAEQEATSQTTTGRRASLPTLYRRLDATRRRYEAAIARASDVTGAAAVPGAPAARVTDTQAALESDEALVEYLVSSDRLLGFVVTPNGITTFERPVSQQNLTTRTRLVRSVLARPGPAGGPTDAPVLEALYDLLIAPARLPASVRRLVVVPHGVLAYLPFAALRNSATGRYLVESMSVLSAPSAAAFVELRRRRAGAPGVQRATVFAPFPDRLPATAVEANAIRRAVGADVQIGRRATEAQFRAALAGGAIVHAATHGILNPRFPLFSRIEFSGGGADPGNDGRLEAHELLGLRVMSPLVFLSGCETGLGVAGSTDFAVGEDFATLGQAFLLAGAGNVVATLWRIEDAGAAAFAERFYVHLSSVGPAEALARAQRDLLGGGKYRAPFYWAAYTMKGTGGEPAQETAGVSVRQ